MDDVAITLLKKQIEEIKLLNSKLKDILKSKGKEEFYTIIESLVKIEMKLNDLITLVNDFVKNSSTYMNEILDIKNSLIELKNLEVQNNQKIQELIKELNDLKNKKK